MSVDPVKHCVEMGGHHWEVDKCTQCPIVKRFGLELTPESFVELSKSLDAITEAERRAWL